MKKKIAILTGKRGGFGAMAKIREGIEIDGQLELQVIATDMHLHATFGNTIDEVRRAVNVDDVIDLGSYGDRPLDRAKALGQFIIGFADSLNTLRPDIILLLGDRGETLAAAVCAAEMGIVIAHIQAGDISGGIDDLHRHAITKLSHLHFSQNEAQRQRVIRMGEHPARVWNTGSPYVDNILDGPMLDSDKVLRTLDLNIENDYVIVLQHPDTYRIEVGYAHTKAILEAVGDRKEDAIVIYPCSDPGYNEIIRAFDGFRGKPGFYFFENLDAFSFLGLLSRSKALIGNSSGGIIEAPYLKIPFVNVGKRQDGREKANNVVSCKGTKDDISKAFRKIGMPSFRQSMIDDVHRFGDGKASERILTVLREIEITPDLFRKRISY